MTPIRPAELTDLDLVVALEAHVFSGEAWSPRSIEEEFEQLGQTRAIFVAIDGSDVVGYAVLLYAGNSGDLPRIAVASSSRRQGVASGLVDALVADARRLGLGQVLLEVASDNEPAMSLYRSKGFDEIDRRARYYAGERDAIVMRLAVDEGPDGPEFVDGRHG